MTFVAVWPRIEWRECNRQFPTILSSEWVSIGGEGIWILTTFDIESTSKAINIISLVHYSAIFCVNKWLTYTGNPILLQFTFKHRFALKRPIGIWRPRRHVHLHLIPVCIRSPCINLADNSAAVGSSYSTIRRNNSLIRRRQPKGAGRIGRPSSVPVCAASRRIYSVVTAVETMKFNAANLHANPPGINPAPVYLASGCV